MASITINNLSRKEALNLLENVQKNAARSYSIQGKIDNLQINTETLHVNVKPVDSGFNGYDYSNNTFKIYSNYWTESSLKEFIS